MHKHIIWDFDGTLFDTYPIMGSLFKKTLEEEGIEENLDEILKYMKVSMATAFEHYEKKYNINSEFIEMIGDRNLDILSAKNAGIQSCLFTDNHKKSDIADFTINNFKQLYSIIS